MPKLHFEKPNLSGSEVILQHPSALILYAPPGFLYVTDGSRQGWLKASMPELGVCMGGGMHVQTVYYMCCDGGRRGE